MVRARLPGRAPSPRRRAAGAGARAGPRPPAETAKPHLGRRHGPQTATESIGVSFARKPHAPASRAAATAESSVTTVSATIRVAGRSRRISRVASGPSRSGMRRSISTTSGRNSAARRTPIRPPEACATTSMSGWAPSSVARPVRNRSWSSTTRTRIEPICCSPSLMIPKSTTFAPPRSEAWSRRLVRTVRPRRVYRRMRSAP